MEKPSKINVLRAAENGAAQTSEQQHRKRAMLARHLGLYIKGPGPYQPGKD